MVSRRHVSIVLVLLLAQVAFAQGLGNLTPSVTAGADQYGRLGDELTFDARLSFDPDGSIVEYAWNWGDGSDIEYTRVPQASHTYDALGLYSVEVTARDNRNAADSDTVQAHICADVQAMLDASAPGDTVVLPACHYQQHISLPHPLTLTGEPGTAILAQPGNAGALIEGNFVAAGATRIHNLTLHTKANYQATLALFGDDRLDFTTRLENLTLHGGQSRMDVLGRSLIVADLVAGDLDLAPANAEELHVERADVDLLRIDARLWDDSLPATQAHVSGLTGCNVLSLSGAADYTLRNNLFKQMFAFQRGSLDVADHDLSSCTGSMVTWYAFDGGVFAGSTVDTMRVVSELSPSATVRLQDNTVGELTVGMDGPGQWVASGNTLDELNVLATTRAGLVRHNDIGDLNLLTSNADQRIRANNIDTGFAFETESNLTLHVGNHWAGHDNSDTDVDGLADTAFIINDSRPCPTATGTETNPPCPVIEHRDTAPVAQEGGWLGMDLMPEADAGGFAYGQPGDLLHFDGALSFDADGTLDSYTWDWGDGTDSTTTTPQASHTFAAPGIYDVELTVTDDDGHSATNSTRAYVCGSIQALVDASTPGDTVVLPACHYREQFNLPHGLTLTGEPGTRIIAPPGEDELVRGEFMEPQVVRLHNLTLDVFGSAIELHMPPFPEETPRGLQVDNVTFEGALARIYPNAPLDLANVTGNRMDVLAHEGGRLVDVMVDEVDVYGNEGTLHLQRFGACADLRVFGQADVTILDGLLRRLAVHAEGHATVRDHDLISCSGTKEAFFEIQAGAEIAGIQADSMRVAGTVSSGNEVLLQDSAITDDVHIDLGGLGQWAMYGITSGSLDVSTTATDGLIAFSKTDDLRVQPNTENLRLILNDLDAVEILSPGVQLGGAAYGNHWRSHNNADTDEGGDGFADTAFTIHVPCTPTGTETSCAPIELRDDHPFAQPNGWEGLDLPPVAEAGPGLHGTAGVAVLADAGSSFDPNDEIIEASWDWGDGMSETNPGPTATHTYAAPGTYTIQLTVKDEAGNTATDITTAYICQSAQALIDASQPGDTVELPACQYTEPLDIRHTLRLTGEPGTVLRDPQHEYGNMISVGLEDGESFSLDNLTLEMGQSSLSVFCQCAVEEPADVYLNLQNLTFRDGFSNIGLIGVHTSAANLTGDNLAFYAQHPPTASFVDIDANLLQVYAWNWQDMDVAPIQIERVGTCAQLQLDGHADFEVDRNSLRALNAYTSGNVNFRNHDMLDCNGSSINIRAGGGVVAANDVQTLWVNSQISPGSTLSLEDNDVTGHANIEIEGLGHWSALGNTFETLRVRSNALGGGLMALNDVADLSIERSNEHMRFLVNNIEAASAFDTDALIGTAAYGNHWVGHDNADANHDGFADSAFELDDDACPGACPRIDPMPLAQRFEPDADDDGDGASNRIELLMGTDPNDPNDTPEVPDAVKGLTTQDHANGVYLAWTVEETDYEYVTDYGEVNDRVTGYAIWRSASPYVRIDTVDGAGNTEFIDETVEAGKTYTYRVVPIMSSGIGSGYAETNVPNFQEIEDSGQVVAVDDGLRPGDPPSGPPTTTTTTTATTTTATGTTTTTAPPRVCTGPDNDRDGIPASCDPNDGAGTQVQGDPDGDGIVTGDNCPTVSNRGQQDQDGDGVGDACDADLDGDGVANNQDRAPSNPNRASGNDVDGDGIDDEFDEDIDGDGRTNGNDNCPTVASLDASDGDGDGKGDVCDDDLTDGPLGDPDADGKANQDDNCPATANAGQADHDQDGAGDVCDDDDDNDGISDAVESKRGTDPLDDASVPAPPSMHVPAVTYEGAAAVLHWQPNALAQQYAVWRSASPYQQIAIVDAPTYVDQDIVDGHVYGYRIVGIDADGVGASTEADRIPGFDGAAEFTGAAVVDQDRDGTRDQDDAFPKDPREWADSDGDGTGDNTDAFPFDAQRTEAEPAEQADLAAKAPAKATTGPPGWFWAVGAVLVLALIAAGLFVMRLALPRD